ncbi:MAG: hypothetical protein GPOALKHO_000885 [Sodalis sp.]|nr:MAG: hypothetical protein GPOALKHO_000885 [Sodalis sp.]
MNVETKEIMLEPEDNNRILSLYWPFDDNIKQLERRFSIEINRRDNIFRLVGSRRESTLPRPFSPRCTSTRQRYGASLPILSRNKSIWPSNRAGYWNKQRITCPIMAAR